MRSFDVNDEDDREEAQRIGAEPWMLELFSLNPRYVHWSPGEDYMKSPKKNGGWDSGIEVASWKEFGWQLDELNECVHFYFQVRRASRECDCGGSGYNPATRRIADDFYDFDGSGRKWHDQITQDEVDALCEHGRLNHQFSFQTFNHETKNWDRTAPNPSAEVVNAAERKGLCHDAINRGILIEVRATRLGVWGLCEQCEGRGYIYTEPTAHASLVLWMLHPRKGCSRGIEILHLDREDLPAVFRWLSEAAKRNAERFPSVSKFEAA